MSGSAWSREEYILTLDLYLNHPEVVGDSADEKVQETASLIGRTPGAVALRLGNYRHIDPAGSIGLSHVSGDCRRIWQEYHDIPSELAREAERIRAELRGSSGTETGPRAADDSGSEVATGESPASGTARQGQTEFRAAILDRYDGECLLCDVQEPGLLVAGHILPWADFEDERGDPDNGILLCYTHHEAFDLGMFTVSESYEMVVSPHFDPEGDFERRTIGDRDGETLSFPEERPNPSYLSTHNERLDWWPAED